jgi:hypothetical protein
MARLVAAALLCGLALAAAALSSPKHAHAHAHAKPQVHARAPAAPPHPDVAPQPSRDAALAAVREVAQQFQQELLAAVRAPQKKNSMCLVCTLVGGILSESGGPARAAPFTVANGCLRAAPSHQEWQDAQAAVRRTLFRKVCGEPRESMRCANCSSVLAAQQEQPGQGAFG